MDFSAFPCRQAKKKPAPPPPAPAPPPPPPPPPKAPTLPEFMQQLPRVPGSRNVEMLFRWNFGQGMGGYHGQNPGFSYGHPNPGPFGPMAPPMHGHMGLLGPPPRHQLLGGGGGGGGHVQPFGNPFGNPFGHGMHPCCQGMPEFGHGMHPFGQGHMDCGGDPFGPPYPHHFGHF